MDDGFPRRAGAGYLFLPLVGREVEVRPGLLHLRDLELHLERHLLIVVVSVVMSENEGLTWPHRVSSVSDQDCVSLVPIRKWRDTK